MKKLNYLNISKCELAEIFMQKKKKNKKKKQCKIACLIR